MNNVNAIKNRHSVRKYQLKQIEQEKIDKLNVMFSECNEKGKLHIQFIRDAGKIYNRRIRTCSYI